MTLALAYGLRTGYRYLGSQLEDPIAALDTVLTDWYLAGWDSIAIVSATISTEFGDVGGSIPGNTTIQGAVVSTECGVAAGAISAIDYTHSFGLKTGNRYVYSQLEDPIAALDTVLTDWYLAGWTLTLSGAIPSTEFGVAVGSANVVRTDGATVSTEFGSIGGSFVVNSAIQGAVITTEYEVNYTLATVLSIASVFVTLTEEGDEYISGYSVRR
jgi:hypothetical protein